MFKGFHRFLNSPAISAVHKPSFIAIVGFSFLLNFTILAVPFYMLQLYDRVMLSRSMETLTFLTLGVLLVMVFNAFMEYVRSMIMIRIGNKLELELNRTLIDSTIIKSAYLNDTNMQIFSDLRQLKNFIAGGHGLVVLLEVPWSPMFIVLMFIAHPALGFASLSFIFILFLTTLLDDYLTANKIEEAQDLMIEANKKAGEVLMGSQAIEAMGMRSNMSNLWMNVNNKSIAVASSASEAASLVQAAVKFLRSIQGIIMMAVGMYLTMYGSITLGAMIVATMLASKGTAPLEMFVESYKNYKLTLTSISRINEQIVSTPSLAGSMSIPIMSGSVEFERVIYAPPGSEHTILKGVSFAIAGGEFLGVIGASGSGKTTLSKLLIGLNRPYSGHSRIDGMDVFSYQKDILGKDVGYLPQEVMLFEGSIKDNISRFGEASDASILEAAQLAGIHDMITRMPNGYDTNVGSRGLSLSGGQRQKIGLARALFGNPKVVVLDEPNSALDHESEQALIETFRVLKERKVTLVVITHKPSLLSHANKLLVLNTGAVEAFGEYDKIMTSYAAK